MAHSVPPGKSVSGLGRVAGSGLVLASEFVSGIGRVAGTWLASARKSVWGIGRVTGAGLALASRSVSGIGRFAGAGLALASKGIPGIGGAAGLILTSESESREEWTADNGATNMFTGDTTHLFNVRNAPAGREYVQIGNGELLRVQCVGSLNLAFHMNTPRGESDFRIQLSEVYVLENLSFNLFSLHHAQRTQNIMLNEKGVHLFDGELVFPRGVNGSSLMATRLAPSVPSVGMTAVYGSSSPPLPTTAAGGVVPSYSPPLPTTAVGGVVHSPPISSFQPVLGAVVHPLMHGGAPPVLDPPCGVVIQGLEVEKGLAPMDMGIFLDVDLMDGYDPDPPESFFPPIFTNEDLHVLTKEPCFQQAAAVLAPSPAAFTVGKPSRTIDINHFHASTGHVNEFLMRETAKQQDVRLTGVLLPCVGCLEAKGRRAPVPRRAGTRAAMPFGRVHIDLCGPLKPALDGSIYMIMFVDSASRWQRPYGMRAKSDTVKYVKRFLADMNGMGTPGCFRTDGGGEFTSREFAEFCDAAGIRREYTAPDTPKQNGVVESAIWRAFKGGHAARRHIKSNPHVELSTIPGMDTDGHRLWLSSTIWASACFNRSATKANTGWASPHETFFGAKPPLKVVPFFQEGMMRVRRAYKSDVQSVGCFFLHGANNHSTSTALVLRADTGRVCHTNNVVWVSRGAGIIPAPVPAIGGGSSAAAPSAAAAPSPEPVYTISLTPASLPPIASPSFSNEHADVSPVIPSLVAEPSPLVPSSAASSPVFAVPSPISVVSSTTHPPPPTEAAAEPPHPTLTETAARELGLGQETRVHGRTRSDAVRFMEEQERQQQIRPTRSGALHHRVGLLSRMDKAGLISCMITRESINAGRRDLPQPPILGTLDKGGEGAGGRVGLPCALATMFATREGVDAALRDQRPPDRRPDLPHCYASDLRVPRSYKEAIESEHGELWEDSVAREFSGLLDAGTFEPV